MTIYERALRTKYKRSNTLTGGFVHPHTGRSYSRLHVKTFHFICCWEDGKRTVEKTYSNWEGVFSRKWFEDREKLHYTEKNSIEL